MKSTKIWSAGAVALATIMVLFTGGCSDPVGQESQPVASGIVTAPSFSLPSGTYGTSQSVILSCTTPGAEIRYTRDGHNPDGPYSPAGASVTMPVDVPTTIWAYATANGMTDSDRIRGDYAIIPSGSDQLAANGDFALGATLWGTWVGTAGGGAASFSFASGVAFMDQTSPGAEWWDLSLRYVPPVLLRNGRICTLVFDARGSVNRGIVVSIGEQGRDLNGNGEVYDKYLWEAYELATNWQTFSSVFGMVSPDDNAPEFAFYLGREGGDVSVDNVSLTVREAIPITAAVMPDAEMRQAIADSAGVSVSTLTEAHLLTVRELALAGYAVTNLTGVALCANLEHLDIGWDTLVSDLEPITDMAALRIVECHGESISDLTPVASLPNLEVLDLDDCPAVSSIAPLIEATRLRELNLENSSVTDLSPLVGLSRLEALVVCDTPVDLAELASVITPTTHPSLRQIRLTGWSGGFPDLEALATYLRSFPTLEELEIGEFGESLADSQFALLYENLLSSMADRLRLLDLNENAITSASAGSIANLTALESLKLDYTQVGDISGLTGLTNLRVLDLRGCPLSDLQPLRTLYDGGAFRPEEDSSIDVEECGLDLSGGTPNGQIVEFLRGQGVEVDS